MNARFLALVLRFAVLVTALGVAAITVAQERDITKLMGIEQKLGDRMPDGEFVDESGAKVHLKDYFGARPVLVLPIYYTCKSGCPLILDGLLRTLTRAGHPTGQAKARGQQILRLGQDLDIVMVGINPVEGPQDALKKKQFFLAALNENGVDGSVHLLTGSLENIRKVTDGIGFRWIYDPNTKVIKHPTGAVLTTTSGVISSYTIGNEFPTKPFTESLRLAATNQVGLLADQSSMFGCLGADPATARNRESIERLVAISCVVFLVFVVGWILHLTFSGNKPSIDRGGQASGA
jgi:protein SCO1/2